MSPPSEREQLSFLTNLQRLLSEGQFVATMFHRPARATPRSPTSNGTRGCGINSSGRSTG